MICIYTVRTAIDGSYFRELKFDIPSIKLLPFVAIQSYYLIIAILDRAIIHNSRDHAHTRLALSQITMRGEQ